MKHPLPDEIRVRSGRAALGLVYGGETFDLPAEFLRVYSPSAQVRGHGPGQRTEDHTTDLQSPEIISNAVKLI